MAPVGQPHANNERPPVAAVITGRTWHFRFQMWWWGGAAQREERDSLSKTCKSKISANLRCQAANGGNCALLEADVIYCLCGSCEKNSRCHKAASEYRACFKEQHEGSQYEGRLRRYFPGSNCDKQLEAMKLCLKKKSLYPQLLQPPPR